MVDRTPIITKDISKANGDKILLNCKGESKSAYKFHWRFFEDKI